MFLWRLVVALRVVIVKLVGTLINQCVWMAFDMSVAVVRMTKWNTSRRMKNAWCDRCLNKSHSYLVDEAYVVLICFREQLFLEC